MIASSSRLFASTRPFHAYRAQASPGASRPAGPKPPIIVRPNTRAAPPPTAPTAPQAGDASAAEKGGSTKTLWQSWMSLPPRTRVMFGTAVIMFSVCGIMLSDQIEALLTGKMPDGTPVVKQKPIPYISEHDRKIIDSRIDLIQAIRKAEEEAGDGPPEPKRRAAVETKRQATEKLV